MAPFTKWLRRNADGVLALLISATVGIVAVLDVFGTNLLGADTINAAILLVLALLAATLLKDRQSVSRALTETTTGRQLRGTEVHQALAEARRHTDLWIFKGGTGTYLRAVTLKEIVENARREQRPLRVQLEIIDPTDEGLCKAYAQFRSSLTPGPDGTGELWTFDRTRKEAFATILAACWYRQRFTFLTIDVGLSSTMTTFRWDVSSRFMIMTQENPAGPALMFDEDKPYYRAYRRELMASFSQTRRVLIDDASDLTLSEEPTVAETRKLFSLLNVELPGSYTDRDVSELVVKALRAKNPYR